MAVTLLSMRPQGTGLGDIATTVGDGALTVDTAGGAPGAFRGRTAGSTAGALTSGAAGGPAAMGFGARVRAGAIVTEEPEFFAVQQLAEQGAAYGQDGIG